MLTKTHLLFLIILIEGYVVLACELLGIRLLVPYVGSGVETTAIIISGVLLPLAVGYHAGGQAFARAYAQSRKRRLRKKSIRGLLLRNILRSLFLLSFGFSYLFLEAFFFGLASVGLTHRLIQTAVYVVCFMIAPMFWLGQTVPLTSHYFSKGKLSAITGRMLFFSTIGSFLGSLFSTLVLMSFIGVHNTVIFTLTLLAILALLIAGKKLIRVLLFCAVMLGLVVALNNNRLMRAYDVVSNNAYNTVRIWKPLGMEDKLVFINNSASSRYSKLPQNRFPYVKYIEMNLVQAMNAKKKGPIDILVMGAGGFDMGRFDTYNNYTYVDIDSALKDITEKYLLEGKMSSNKKFIASSARAFIHREKKKYDLVVVDVYTQMSSMPMEATTAEFYQEIKKHLNPDGILAANIIAHAMFGDPFSVRFHNTFTSVFPVSTRQVLDIIELVSNEEQETTYDELRNVLYIYVNSSYTDDTSIYTDDKNTHSLDIP